MQSSRLFEVFEMMKNHTSDFGGGISLSTVQQTFGKKALEAVSSYPHIVWVPTADDYGPYRLNSYPGIVSGKRVHIESLRTRSAGCDLYVFHQNHHLVEELLNDIIVAFYQELGATGAPGDPRNWTIVSGRWFEDPAVIKNNSIGYILSITCQFPVFRLMPAELAQTVSVSVVSQVQM